MVWAGLGSSASTSKTGDSLTATIMYLTRDADASVLSEYLARNHAALAPLLPGDTVPAVQKEMGGAPRGLTRVGACFGEVIAGSGTLREP